MVSRCMNCLCWGPKVLILFRKSAPHETAIPSWSLDGTSCFTSPSHFSLSLIFSTLALWHRHFHDESSLKATFLLRRDHSTMRRAVDKFSLLRGQLSVVSRPALFLVSLYSLSTFSSLPAVYLPRLSLTFALLVCLKFSNCFEAFLLWVSPSI